MILLIYFILIKNSTLITKLIWFCIITFVAAFARPELLIIAEISTLFTILLCSKNYKNISTHIPLLLLLVVTIVILFIFISLFERKSFATFIQSPKILIQGVKSPSKSNELQL